MSTINFGIFDITIAFVSRKHEDRFWFHQIWNSNEEYKEKKVKKRKKRKIRSIRYRWLTARVPLDEFQHYWKIQRLDYFSWFGAGWPLVFWCCGTTRTVVLPRTYLGCWLIRWMFQRICAGLWVILGHWIAFNELFSPVGSLFWFGILLNFDLVISFSHLHPHQRCSLIFSPWR